jgi:NAD(P)-dependent dehydrogenase (short-subunit alcohol dehydrogenase family)
MTLSGQRVVVVGGTSGMGLATVRAAAAQGAEVVAAGRRAVASRAPIEGVRQAEVDDLRRRVADALPTGRIGTPEDIAHAAIFLMTSRQTTGAMLEVSGDESLVDRLD